jgi:glycosyltransferase involved in cell wall biosynthesis
MKVALVYDRVNKWGGAERVLLALHELFPDAPLYTSVYHSEKARWAKKITIKTSFLQKIPFARTHHELIPFLMPIAFESFSFDEYDLVISVTSEAAKGIITKGKTKHICYCLTPTRYLWSGYNDYFGHGIFSLLTKPVVSYLRNWDRSASRRPDAYIAISEEVQKRIKQYYNRDSLVVYPPLTEFNSKKTQLPSKDGDFFLVVSRLSKFTKYKRIDLAIKACTELGLPLKIIGTGNWEPELRSIAGPSVEFLGNLTDEEIVAYYKSCTAFLFPGEEDFGLTILEAQACGKPVIAYKGGGALEILIDGKTGMFFTPQRLTSLKKTLLSFDRKQFNPDDCRKQAERFNKKRFKKAFLSAIRAYV